MPLVTVARFRDPPAAHVARALLEAHGIESFLANEHYVGMDWLHSQAVGGVELRVHAEQRDQARALLDDPPPLPAFAQGEEAGPPAERTAGSRRAAPERCPECDAAKVEPDRLDHRIRAASLGLGFPAAIGGYRFHCGACGHRWRAVPPHRGLGARLADLFALVFGIFAAILALPVWIVARLLGRRGQRLECWACGVPFEAGEGRCAECGVPHPPPAAFEGVIEPGRRYDAACASCHTPYVRSGVAGAPAVGRCAFCDAPLEREPGRASSPTPGA